MLLNSLLRAGRPRSMAKQSGPKPRRLGGRPPALRQGWHLCTQGAHQGRVTGWVLAPPSHQPALGLRFLPGKRGHCAVIGSSHCHGSTMPGGTGFWSPSWPKSAVWAEERAGGGGVGWGGGGAAAPEQRGWRWRLSGLAPGTCPRPTTESRRWDPGDTTVQKRPEAELILARGLPAPAQFCLLLPDGSPDTAS